MVKSVDMLYHSDIMDILTDHTERDENMTLRDELISYISDEYKALNGFRPRYDWSSYTLADLEREADELEQRIIHEREQQELADATLANELLEDGDWADEDWVYRAEIDNTGFRL